MSQFIPRFLLVSSPEAECGKTTLLSLISLMVPRGIVIVEVSPAVLFRMVEKWHPTLIVDEADSVFKSNPELRSIINSGWTRGTGVPRCHPETHDPEFFETFGPKAIGLKGLRIPDTTLSRSIIIEMERKLPDDKVTDFAHADDKDLAVLRSKLARFAQDNMERLRHPSPVLPEGFGNRLAANWKMMLAIAELCGVGEKARAAAVALSRRTTRQASVSNCFGTFASYSSSAALTACAPRISPISWGDGRQTVGRDAMDRQGDHPAATRKAPKGLWREAEAGSLRGADLQGLRT